MKRYKYHAVVTLYPPQQGGLQERLPPETRCLVVRAEHRDTHRSKLFSSVVSADDERPFCPGDTRRVVTMQLNGDDASQYVGAGARFGLWFGTDVGHGVVTRQLVNWP